VGEHGPPLPALVEATGAARLPGPPLLRSLGEAAAELGDAATARRAFAAAGEPAAASRFRAGDGRPSSSSPHLPGPTYRVALLGVPEMTRLGPDGDEPIRWRLHRSLLAVARLALAPEHRLPRDELIEALFPEQSADHIKRNFHPTLSSARRALGGGRAGGIVQHHGIYALDPAATWHIDVDIFERHLATASAEGGDTPASKERTLAELEAAWRLYRGPLLDGFEAEWLVAPRQRQRGHYLDMLRHVGELAGALGRETLALDAFRRLLLDEPFEEKIHLELMGLYGRRGRRDLVRRQFVHLQELLKDLHAEPAEETVERYHQLMR
ncbi:MAG: bacterial transcriptional activator domain-containing protein, partial [Acidobacteriota bacterium]